MPGPEVFLPSHRLRSWGPLERCSASGRASTNVTPLGDTLTTWFLAGGTGSGQALFNDDTPGHVAAAQALGMARHVRADPQTTAAAIEAFVATP
jgi:hypothetical protein